jgi:shikimate kinase
VVVVGPIGVGKSSSAEYAADYLTSRGTPATHIDGDVLGLDPQQVLSLGMERSAFTIWQLIQAIAAGMVPILSTGGGVLLGNGNKSILKASIAKAFGVPLSAIHVTVIAPQNATAAYEDTERVKDCIRWRVANSAEDSTWQVPTGKTPSEFATKIAALSMKNLPIVLSCIAAADYIGELGMRVVNGVIGYDIDQIVSHLGHIAPNSAVLPMPVANQHRILVLMPDGSRAGHITTGFYSGSTPPALTPFAYTNMQVSCVMVVAGRGKIRILVPLRHGDYGLSTNNHITVAAGKHEAKEMWRIADAYHSGHREVDIPNKTCGGITSYAICAEKKHICVTLGPAFGVLNL